MKGKRSQGGSRTRPARAEREPRAYRQARDEIEREMGVALRDEAWQLYIEKGYIGQFIVGELQIDVLIKDIQAFQAAFGQAIPILGEGARMLTPEMRGASVREESISRLAAKLASRDLRVRAFRADALGIRGDSEGGLLDWPEVETWISRTAMNDAEGSGDRGSTWWLDGINVPAEYARTADKLVTTRDQASAPELNLRLPPSDVLATLTRRYLEYSMIDDTGWRERRIAVTACGTLDRLRQLSVVLGDMYGWTHAQATIFALTGLPPLIASVFAAREVNEAIPGLTSITLAVDPTLSPKEVQEAYRKVRQRLLGERHREMSDKHMRLAEFAGTEMEEASTIERMNEWNRRYPEWAYSQPRVFRQDSIGAQKRLIGVVVARGGTTDAGDESDAGTEGGEV